MSAPDARTVRLAIQLLERTAGRRRRCRRCGQAIVENAGKAGTAWSVCGSCTGTITADARQLTIAPPLIHRCLVCLVPLAERRRGTRTCGPACRSVLSRILRPHLSAPRSFR